MKQKILVLSYYFSPQNIVSAFRILKFTKYLSVNGFRPYIFTSDDNSILRNNDLENDIPEDSVIFRRKYFHKIQKTANVISRKRTPLNYMKRLLKELFFSPDKYIWWNLSLIPLIIKTIKKENIKIALVTGNPFSSFITMILLKFLVNIKVVLDFRDPWSTNVANKGQTFIRRISNSIFEKFCVNKADLIISVTEEIIEKLKKYTKDDKFQVIPNGYDPDDFVDIDTPPIKKSEFLFLYTGKYSIKMENYNPETLISSFINFCHLHSEKKYVLQFIGMTDNETKKYIAGLNKSNIRLIDPLPKKAVLGWQSVADVLIHFYYPQSHEDAISMKVFEYAQHKKLILSFNTKSGALYNFLEKTGLGKTSSSNDIEEMTALFTYAVSNTLSRNKKLSVQLYEYSYPVLTKKLAELLVKL